jgi:tRNA A-37 threonylcarbamoyl transferase component Bud32
VKREPVSQLATKLRHSDTEVIPVSGRSSDVHIPRAAVGSIVDDRYLLVREIAHGGGGIVFEGEHVHTRARVAVKTMSYTAFAQRGRARVLREARALGMVRHPNIVSVLDAGDCRQCGAYVVLSLIEGRTLESFVTARSRIDARTTVAIAQQLAAALSVLAKKGVVHRDVKPSNVLLVPGSCGDSDSAILIDFGVAKITNDEDARITRNGDLVGTPVYMAPEQISGMDPVDHRTDVYGLGALLYECLTGTTPFKGQPLAVAIAILSGALPLPIAGYRPDVPAALEAAILRALSPRPAARWPDAVSFARGCVAAIGGDPGPLYLFPRGLDRFDGERPEGPRRMTGRIPYQAPARFFTADGKGHDGKVEDISSAGMLVVTAADIAVEAAIRTKFPLPMSGRVVTLAGTVRWTRPRQSARTVGIEFSQLPGDVRSEIELFSIPVY